MVERIAYTVFESPWEQLLVASSRRGLCLVQFGRSLGRARTELARLWGPAEWVESPRENAEVLRALGAYVRGDARHFALPLDLRGTPFQLAAWRALLRIPYGATRSYQELARAAGRPRAVRAAGMACGSNRVPIIVPCHRVVGSDGSLTGFSALGGPASREGGGLRLKQELLAHECRSKFAMARPKRIHPQ
ncbi:MAG: methylated-DNA--[protein]-cysteine S-methyltransferase [Terriglobia bacterium]